MKCALFLGPPLPSGSWIVMFGGLEHECVFLGKLWKVLPGLSFMSETRCALSSFSRPFTPTVEFCLSLETNCDLVQVWPRFFSGACWRWIWLVFLWRTRGVWGRCISACGVVGWWVARGRLLVRRGVGDVRVAFLPVLLEEFVFKLSFLSAQLYTRYGVLGLSLDLKRRRKNTHT